MRSARIKFAFLLLVIVQAMHSIEEYIGRLWEVFAPAKMLCGLISDDLETGFLVINFGLFVFGFLCWIGPVRQNHVSAKGLIWFWIIVEMINGIGHPIWTINERSYTPGIVTAPLLLVIAMYLFIQLSYRRRQHKFYLRTKAFFTLLLY